MFGIKNLESRIESTQDAIDLMNNQAKQNIKYPCRINGMVEMTPIWELNEQYKTNQIRWMTNKIKEYEYLISLLK